MKIVLIGGYPKGYDEPFHPKTASGRILRKIESELNINPTYFDLWKTKEEEDTRLLSTQVKNKLSKFTRDGYILIALGRYIEKVIVSNNIECQYLPHPASRDKKYVQILKNGLKSIQHEH